MFAAIDVGNTAVKLALFDGEKVLHRWRFATDVALQPVDYWTRFRSVLIAQDIRPSSVTEAAIVSVVPDVTLIIDEACREFFRCAPFTFAPGAAVPVETRYDPALGADRLMNVVAAVRFHGPGPLVVVDLGTAVKFEAVDGDGVHLGGAISPGIAIATDELFSRAALVARTSPHVPDAAVGRSTQKAVDAGVFLGYAGMVNAMVARFRGELDSNARVIATGGWAAPLAGECRFDEIDPDLTVKGLRVVYELNADATGRR